MLPEGDPYFRSGADRIATSGTRSNGPKGESSPSEPAVATISRRPYRSIGTPTRRPQQTPLRYGTWSYHVPTYTYPSFCFSNRVHADVGCGVAVVFGAL